jgi:Arc/MetJ-type ribon-helix-helix transcriptional regulator
VGDSKHFITYSIFISRHDLWRIHYLVKTGEYPSVSEAVRHFVHEGLKTEKCPAAVTQEQIAVPLLDKKHRKPRKTKVEKEIEKEKIVEKTPKEPQKTWDSDAWIARAKEQGML